MKYCFVFICQGGTIEPQAVLLAASLRYFVQCDAEIVACIPDYPEVKPPTDHAIDFFRHLGIRTETITNPVDNTYLIANKLACLNINTNAEQLIFLDSDMLCVQEFYGSRQLDESYFAARLTDFSDLEKSEWEQIYSFSGWGAPEFKYRSMVDNISIPLSLNAGFIAVKNPKQLHNAWVRWAKKLNHKQHFPKTRPFLDQISLPFAVMELGLDIELLDQSYNYSSAVYPLDVFQLPNFVHYYESIHLLGDAFLSDVTLRLIDNFDGLEPLIK